jgi:LPS export ABC transporter protein LptC
MIHGLSNADLNNVNSVKAHFLLISRCCLLMLVASLYSCKDTELKEPVEYTGPLRKIQDVELFYTEKNAVKVKMIAAQVWEYENGDREFPAGLYIEFYNEFGKMESTLRANQAYFFKKENQWRGRGKVEVKNIEKNEQLNTEELFWKPAEENIFTEKFVTIRQQGDVIYGQGLEAKQDMSDYRIKKVVGEFEVDEDN